MYSRREVVRRKLAVEPMDLKSLKKAVNDPSHEEYASYREWIGLEEGELWNNN